jgi:hypothetical protein
MAAFSWFGYRNIAYIGFLVLLTILANLPSHTDPAGRGLEAGFVYGLLLLISLPFLGVNAVLFVIALVKNRPLVKPSFACLLTIAPMMWATTA